MEVSGAGWVVGEAASSSASSPCMPLFLSGARGVCKREHDVGLSADEAAKRPPGRSGCAPRWPSLGLGAMADTIAQRLEVVRTTSKAPAAAVEALGNLVRTAPD